MKKTIEKLRQKEQHQKERIALGGAFIITAFIFFIWLLGFTTIDSTKETQVANTLTPWQSIQKEFSKIFNSDN